MTHVVACPGVSSSTVTALLARQPVAAAPAAHATAAVQFLPSPQPAAALWKRALALLAATPPPPPQGDVRQSYGNILVLLDEHTHAEMVWAALGLDEWAHGSSGSANLRVSPGGLSVIEFAADPRVTPATVRCINNRAHCEVQGAVIHPEPIGEN